MPNLRKEARPNAVMLTHSYGGTVGGNERKSYKLAQSKDRLHSERVKETMIKWARDFGYNIDIDHWTLMWKDCYKMIKPVNLRENVLKMFYRWHYTPTKLAKMSEGSSNICWKCKKKSRNLLPYVVVM